MKKCENKSLKVTARLAFIRHKSVHFVLNEENEYSKKLNEFEKIFNSSNEKIQEMENEFNEDEFV